MKYLEPTTIASLIRGRLPSLEPKVNLGRIQVTTKKGPLFYSVRQIMGRWELYGSFIKNEVTVFNNAEAALYIIYLLRSRIPDSCRLIEDVYNTEFYPDPKDLVFTH